MNTSSTTFADLQALFPGKYMIDGREVAQALGINEKTIRNKGDRFSVPSVKIGGVRRFKLTDLAAVIDGETVGRSGSSEAGEDELVQPVMPMQPATKVRRGPGRPRKVAGGAA